MGAGRFSKASNQTKVRTMTDAPTDPKPTLRCAEVAAYLAARMCHDFISPAGAITSGLDLLEDPSAQDMRDDAMALIADSARKLVALLSFDRVAFGASQAAEAFIAATDAKISIGGDRAFYRPSADIIAMPDRHRFIGTETSTATEGWYSTLLHEMTHWSGASHRMDRTFGKRFGDDAYAMEEMVAELGAAFLCGDLGITAEPRPDHAAYIGNWLRILKSDRKAIFTAASAANKAAEFLANFSKIEHKEAA